MTKHPTKFRSLAPTVGKSRPFKDLVGNPGTLLTETKYTIFDFIYIQNSQFASILFKVIYNGLNMFAN